MAIDFLQLETKCQPVPERLFQEFSPLSQDPPDPGKAIRAAILHLSDKGADHLGAQLIPWLAQTDHYLSAVLDPEFLSLQSAKRVCRLFRQADPYFFTQLSRHAFNIQKPTLPSSTTRALAILDELSKDDPVVPWLRQLTTHSDERVRSKAVKVLCRLRPSKSILELHLKSADPRVRANAIEALWHTAGSETVLSFRSALSDTHHRVVANALVGLYYRKEPNALTMMINLTDHPSPRFRVAVVWAMGAVADRRAVPTLKKLLGDPSEAVREKAQHVLGTFGPKGGGSAEHSNMSEPFTSDFSEAETRYPQVA